MLFTSRLVSLLFVSLLLMSAAPQKTANIPVTPAIDTAAIAPSEIAATHVVKQNFFQRLLFKMMAKRAKRNADVAKGDRQATTSLVLSVTAALLLVVPVLASAGGALFVASIPVAIAAIVVGGSALRNGTNEITKAKLGRGLGWGTLVTFAVLLIVAAIALSSSDWW